MYATLTFASQRDASDFMASAPVRPVTPAIAEGYDFLLHRYVYELRYNTTLPAFREYLAAKMAIIIEADVDNELVKF